jgi:hypothetical protein
MRFGVFDDAHRSRLRIGPATHLDASGLTGWRVFAIGSDHTLCVQNLTIVERQGERLGAEIIVHDQRFNTGDFAAIGDRIAQHLVERRVGAVQTEQRAPNLFGIERNGRRAQKPPGPIHQPHGHQRRADFRHRFAKAEPFQCIERRREQALSSACRPG